jgi:hypothetical protein
MFEEEPVDQPGIAPHEVCGLVHVDVCHPREVTCFGAAGGREAERR